MLRFPDRDVDEIPFTCALDIADRGPASEDILISAMNLTREAVRRIALDALAKIGARAPELVEAVKP